MNIGIYGYGNLGKAVEETLLFNQSHTLVAIFSNRYDSISSDFNTPIFSPKELKNFTKSIDIIINCSGSYQDIEKQAKSLLKKFNTIDSFDTHAKLDNYISSLDKIAKTNKKIALCAFGWDPGLLSLIRGIFNSINHNNPITFWGKGISQGHSNALRSLENVEDAVQYTVPIKRQIEKSKKEYDYLPSSTHKRLCYLCAEKEHRAILKKQIKSMPNYFEGYKVKIKFINDEKIKQMKLKPYHSGNVISLTKLCGKYKSFIELNLMTESNPHFTASILVMGINIIENLKNNYGAYNAFDVPIKYWSEGDFLKFL